MAEPVFSHSAPETLTVLAISCWLAFTGLWVLRSPEMTELGHLNSAKAHAATAGD